MPYFSRRLFTLTCMAIVFLVPVCARAQGTSNLTEGNVGCKTNPMLPQAVPTKAPLSFPIGSGLSRAFQSITGITMLTQFVAGQVTGRVIQRKIGGKVKVKVRTWSLTDLLSGKMKSVEIRLKGGAIKGVRFGEIRLASATPIWVCYRKHQGERPGLRVPIFLTFSSRISQDDVSSILKSDKAASCLRALKLDLPGLGEQQLEVLNPVVSIGEDLVKINGVLVTAGAGADTGVPMTLAGGLKLQGNDRIILANLAVESSDILEPKKFAAFVEQLVNPLVNLNRFDRRNLAIRLNSLKVAGGWLEAQGTVLVGPRAQNLKAATGDQH